MDPREGSSKDVFRRSGKTLRSPTTATRESQGGSVSPELEVPQESRKRKEITPPTAMTKKPCEDLAIEEEDIVVEREPQGDYKDMIELLKTTCNDLLQWGSSQFKSKKITNIQHGVIKTKLEEMNLAMSGLERETYFMAGRLAERIRIEQEIVVPRAEGAPTYAEAARIIKMPKVSGVPKLVPPNVMFVRSKDEKVNVEEVKKIIKSSIKPSKIGVNIKKVVKTARGLMIETDGATQLDKIKSCSELTDKGLVFDKPVKKLPRIMIYDVDVPDEVNEFVEEVFEQNMSQELMTYEEFKSNFRVVHKYKKRDPRESRQTIVVECSAKVRNELRRRDRIYIGWQSCRIKDYNPVVRCYKCQSFGHVAKYCRQKDRCSHCAEEHELKSCKNLEQPARCVNCLTVKKEANHQINSPKCPEFIRATRIAYERIDYGY